MKDEEILRKQAIELYLQGISIVSIADKLGKSRQWVHKWIKRYKTGMDNWFNSVSNAPKYTIKKIPDDIEKTIVFIRQNLKGHKYAQKGALSILHELGRLNKSLPSISTINRVIKRNNLVDKGSLREIKKKNIPIISSISNKWILWDPNI